MIAKDHIPALQATATAVLPGMKQARSLLDATIRVLEYFEKHAAHDAANRRMTPQPRAEPQLIEDAAQVRATLSAFGKLQSSSH
jgi:hypothetical protein